MKEDEEEEQIIKNVPVLNKDELGKNPNKKNKFLYIGLLIGVIVIIISIF